MALKILHHVSSHNWKITKQEEKQGEKLKPRGSPGCPRQNYCCTFQLPVAQKVFPHQVVALSLPAPCPALPWLTLESGIVKVDGLCL